MQPVARRIVLSGLVLVLCGLTSVGIYASATTFLNHQVAVNHLRGAAGGFTDDTGLWAIEVDPNLRNTVGLLIYSFDISPAGTTQASPSILVPGVGALISNGVTAGDWVLQMTITNTTSIPVSTTWSFGITILEDGVYAQLVTLYFKSPTTLSPGTIVIFAVIDTVLGQSLQTPFSYTAVVRQI